MSVSPFKEGSLALTRLPSQCWLQCLQAAACPCLFAPYVVPHRPALHNTIPPRTELHCPAFCAVLQEDFKEVVARHSDGFVYQPERPDAPTFVEQKWGWRGLQPGRGGGACSQVGVETGGMHGRHRCWQRLDWAALMVNGWRGGFGG